MSSFFSQNRPNDDDDYNKDDCDAGLENQNYEVRQQHLTATLTIAKLQQQQQLQQEGQQCSCAEPCKANANAKAAPALHCVVGRCAFGAHFTQQALLTPLFVFVCFFHSKVYLEVKNLALINKLHDIMFKFLKFTRLKCKESKH